MKLKDLTHRNDKYFGQVRHWLTTRVTVSPTGQVNVSNDRDISPYVGPAPIPAHYFTLGYVPCFFSSFFSFP